MMKIYDRLVPQQRWFKPSLPSGIQGAKYTAMLGGRYAGSKGVVVGGALGFVGGSLIGGVLDELDVL